MRKIIFLDFDGVITTLKSRWKLDKEKLELLKRIVDETDCLFVISSAWRRGNLEQGDPRLLLTHSSFLHWQTPALIRLDTRPTKDTSTCCWRTPGEQIVQETAACAEPMVPLKLAAVAALVSTKPWPT